ncbi:hypothetical protein [Rubrivirga sp.]|uniref:hypothetical protein n=1 Tax=Rubrivirga sp. TaxID=1885344 RepID=UPI003B515C12
MTPRLSVLLLVGGTLVFSLAACDATAPADGSTSGLAVAQDASANAGGSERHKAVGSGYADFVLDGGAEGENRYWTSAHRDPNGRLRGTWRADVYIDFGSFVFDFEATYTVDCLEVDPDTREAWVEGTVFRANDPEFLGRRAFLYLKDGGPGGQDLHALTPLDDPDVRCTDRPAPDFMEEVERGNYVVQ